LDLYTAGNAYIFNAMTGALITTLSSPNAQTGGQFGYSVAIDGNNIVIGALTETAGGYAYDGHAYIYSMGPPGPGSGKYTTLTMPNPVANCDASPNYDGDFGSSVAIMANTVVVGAWTNAVGGNCDAGNAYVFNAMNGNLMATLVSPNAQLAGYFGYPVAIGGPTVAVGAPGEHNEAGSAYTFDPHSGRLLSSLASPNPLQCTVVPACSGPVYTATITTSGGDFGVALALSGNSVVVGAPYETVDGYSGAGAAYIFGGGPAPPAPPPPP